MTNEEAIKNIKEHCYFANLIPRAKEALDMAIKALEQEPCDDAISRQAVLDMMQMRMGAKELYRAVYDLPSVTPATENDKFLEFLWNTINPNEMEQYLAMYHAKEEKTNG